MECEELKKVIESNHDLNCQQNETKNSVPKIMILDQLEPICKNTEIFGKQQPQIDTLSTIFKDWIWGSTPDWAKKLSSVGDHLEKEKLRICEW